MGKLSTALGNGVKRRARAGEGNVAADGAIAWKAVKFRREIGSAKTLDEPAIHVVRRVILRAVHKSTASVSIDPVISLEE